MRNFFFHKHFITEDILFSLTFHRGPERQADSPDQWAGLHRGQREGEKAARPSRQPKLQPSFSLNWKKICEESTHLWGLRFIFFYCSKNRFKKKKLLLLRKGACRSPEICEYFFVIVLRRLSYESWDSRLIVRKVFRSLPSRFAVWKQSTTYFCVVYGPMKYRYILVLHSYLLIVKNWSYCRSR